MNLSCASCSLTVKFFFLLTAATDAQLWALKEATLPPAGREEEGGGGAETGDVPHLTSHLSGATVSLLHACPPPSSHETGGGGGG